MTIEERLARIEFLTAGMDDERRRQREEDRQLWREVTRSIAEANAAITRLAEESRAADRRLDDRIDRLAAETTKLTQESRAADSRLEERIGALVSAMGRFMAGDRGPAV